MALYYQAEALLISPDVTAEEFKEINRELSAAYADIQANGRRITIERNATVSGIQSKTYTGKKLTQSIVLNVNGVTLIKGTDYKLSYANNVNAGTATVRITGIGNYKGKLKRTFQILKAKNTLTVSPKSVKVSASKLKKDARTILRKNAMTVLKAKGTVTFSLLKMAPAASSEYFQVDKTNGNILIAKGLKAGTYRLKIRITAAGDENYKKLSQPVIVTVTVA